MNHFTKSHKLRSFLNQTQLRTYKMSKNHKMLKKNHTNGSPTIRNINKLFYVQDSVKKAHPLLFQSRSNFRN